MTTRVLRREKDSVLRAQMVEPDFTDAELDFGSMAMRAGTAFSLGDEEATRSIQVGKQYRMIGGQPVLIEAVEFKQLEPLLTGLASVERADTSSLAMNSSRQVKRAKEQARLPQQHFRAFDNQKEIQLASSPLTEPSVVIDYELLQSSSNMVVKGDTTWFVSGLVNLSGTTRLEGCVIKFTNSTSARINFNGSIDCQTGPYRPAIFTSQYDSSVGDAIGTGTPTNYPGALVINTSGSVLHDLRIAYATSAVSLGFSSGQISLTNVQFVHCQYPIDSSTYDENTILVDNGLFYLAKYGVRGGRDLIVRGRHLTAHQCEKFAYSPSGGDSYAYLTNCLLVGVTNWGSEFTFTTNSTAYYATDAAGIFQTVGAGSHYLVAGSTNRDVGTTNISASLLAALTQKTTYPPLVYSNLTLTTNVTLSIQAPRDTNTPDLGYHYDALDFIAHYCAITNATITVEAGTAVACYNDVGLWLQDGTTITSIGTPLLPNRFTRYSAVQEQPVVLGAQGPGGGLAVDSAPYGSVGANAEFRFTEFSCPAGGGYHLYHSPDLVYSNLLVRDCALWNGTNRLSGPSSNAIATVRNNLFHRSTIYAVATGSQCRLALSNNLVLGAAVTLVGPASDLWQAHDNAFDACYIVNVQITNSHNAYINTTGRLYPTNVSDVMLSSFTYANGPLGRYYQLSTNLFEAGSLTNAGLAGLYHHTTTTNQVKEASTRLDIGYHYVAVSNGLPVDTDGDSQADYFEDTNGNGLFDTNDFGWVTNFLYVSSTATNFQSITEDEAEKFDRPDSMGAVGPNHFMAVLNYVVKVYDKATGQPLATNSLDEFLQTTVTNGPYEGTYPNPQHGNEAHTGDPRVIYDSISQRWFASAVYIASNHVLVTVSKTSDPFGNGGTNWFSENWTHYLVPMGWVPTNCGVIDQPKLAVGSSGVYIAAYATPFYGSDPSYRLRIAAMPKTPFLDPTASTVQTGFIFDCPTNNDAQIAVDIDPVSTNDSVWLIYADMVAAVPGTNLYYNRLKWTNGSPAGLEMTNWGQVSIGQSYSSARDLSAPQQGTSSPRIRLLDSRLMAATMKTLNGTQYLWTCRHIGVNQYGTNGTPAADRAAVEWFKIQTAPTVTNTDTGRIYDASASNPKFYYCPSLAVNRNGDLVIGFSGSSVNDFASAFCWGRLHNGASVNAPIRYFAGLDWVNEGGGGATVLWGDYSHTSLDPVDGVTMWTIQEYAETRTSGPSTYTWGTRITAVRPY